MKKEVKPQTLEEVFASVGEEQILILSQDLSSHDISPRYQDAVNSLEDNDKLIKTLGWNATIPDLIDVEGWSEILLHS